MINAADLPNDIDALKALLLARDEKILGLEAQLNTRATEIEHLKLMIAKLRRMQFGRKSEKVDHQIEQLELQLEDLQADEAVAEREMPEADRAPRRKSVRRPLPDHLPRDEKIYAPGAEACPACGGGLRPLGEDVAEQLEYVPASFRVIHHVRPKLACSCCDAIVQAPAPSRPIERGIAGPGLLAHVLVAKFADHLPLYRQAVIYARDGVDLDRALLASWVGAASALLRPLVDAIRHHVLAGASCTRTTPRFRCWHRAMAKQRRRGCGPTCAMTGRAATLRRRPCGLPIRQIARAFIRKPTSPTMRACCKQMLTPASTRFTRTARSRRQPAGRMRAASSTTCTKPDLPH
jgi:transposase